MKTELNATQNIHTHGVVLLGSCVKVDRHC